MTTGARGAARRPCAVCLLALCAGPLRGVSLGEGFPGAGLLHAQWRGAVALEGQVFPAVRRASPELAVVFTGRGSLDLGASGSWLAVEPFLLIDLNGSRTRLDLPEAGWTARWDEWEVGVGSRTVSWGVTESTHATDIVNQRLPHSTGRGYRKLGQPMVTGSWLTGAGSFEALILPGFRERPLAGQAARLWSGWGVDATRSRGERRAGRHAVDWAIRWSHAAGPWDVALSHFSGRGRDPVFEPAAGEAGVGLRIPSYPLIDQTAIELQWTRAAWLLKLEALTRAGSHGSHRSLTGGLEHAIADYLSVFLEYAYDARGAGATTSLEHDAFVGGRLLADMGSVEAGLFVDTRSGNRIARAAVRRSLTDRLTLAVEARGFWGDREREPPQAFTQEALVSLALLAVF